METIKINFSHFWDGFDKKSNWFSYFLSKRYNVEISDDPDLFIFTHSYNGENEYLKYNCHRIFLGWENDRADWDICDYVLDCDYVKKNIRHRRYPLWVTQENIRNILKPRGLINIDKKFCCMVVSNGKAKERIEFFHKLSEYKKVDSGGRYLNNIGGPVDNKMDFIKNYKFVIAFENSSFPGYTTEKIVQPMMVNAIPIYWGNPVIGKEFNTKSFININDYKNIEEAIAQIIKLDKDDEAFYKMLNEPRLIGNIIPPEFETDSMLEFFDFIVQDSKKTTPVARQPIKRYKHLIKKFIKRVKNSIFTRLGLEVGFR